MRQVLVLHVAYGFIPLGFLLASAAALLPASVPSSAGIHAWMAGGAGLMTLAVMTRATLGHTGRTLVASPATQIIYGLALAAALARIAASFGGSILLAAHRADALADLLRQRPRLMRRFAQRLVHQRAGNGPHRHHHRPGERPGRGA